MANNMSEDLDMNLYSRQLGTYGLDAMKKLVNLKVLISGMQGVGAETAKNLILAGPGAVTIHDSCIVEASDLGSNFCLSESDIGCKTRGEASLKFLSTLNPYVNISLYSGLIDESIIAKNDCIVICNFERQSIIRTSEFCRILGKALIVVGIYGLAASVFVDFGPTFIVKDPDGEEPKHTMVESIISNGKFTLVNCTEDKRMPFSAGDWVVFEEIEGLEELNSVGPQEVIRVSRQGFEIELDLSNFRGHYVRGGTVRQLKKPVILEFRAYHEACDRPIPPGEAGLISVDMAKFGRAEQLHIATQALLAYSAAKECLPEHRDPIAVRGVIQMAQELNRRLQNLKENYPEVVCVDEVDENIVAALTSFAACHISPVAAFIGGVVAQEVVKLCEKYTPLHQWLYYDAFEVIDGLNMDVADCVPLGCRYDDGIVIWGSKIQERLSNIRVFLVGAGALGCEYMKSFAMLGISTGPQGLVVVTDMDHIEVSNLNRQFLFRRDHVGKSKSDTAAKAIAVMNPGVRVKSIQLRVGIETEEVFDDEFWTNVDVVVNALDNIQSRLYVDSKCVWNLKPLLEAGTLGTKANIQVIMPKLTESYGDSRDPPEDSIPLCTLRHFPNQIEHAIEWARDLFQGLFHDGIRDVKKILENSKQGIREINQQASMSRRREQYTRVASILDCLIPSPSYEKCVEMAVKLFHYLYFEDISQLLFSFPLNRVNPNGSPFWSGPKRPPQAIRIDASEESHVAFVTSCANLFAAAMGIPVTMATDAVVRKMHSVVLPEFRPRIVRIKTDDNDTQEEGGVDDGAACERLQAKILDLVPESSNLTVSPLDFEKDDDTNFQMDFITAAGNLRARNYKIPEAERWKAKIIAGKIVPAIATTTAMITGLASTELLKVATAENRPLEHYKSGFANLGLPLWVLSEPYPPRKNCAVEYDPIIGGPVRAKPDGFTPWDKVTMEMRGCTLGDVIAEIEQKFDSEVNILSAGNYCMYNSFDKSQKERLQMPLTQLVTKLCDNDMRGTDFNLIRDYVVIHACCTDSDGVDVNIPAIKCVYK